MTVAKKTKIQIAQEAAEKANARLQTLKRQQARKEASQERQSDDAYKFVLGGWLSSWISKKGLAELQAQHEKVARTLDGKRLELFKQHCQRVEEEVKQRDIEAKKQALSEAANTKPGAA